MSAGRPGEEDGAGARRTEGERSGESPLPPPLCRGGVAAGAAGERLGAGGVRLPGMRFRARGPGGRGERGCQGTERGSAASCQRLFHPPSVGSGRSLSAESESPASARETKGTSCWGRPVALIVRLEGLLGCPVRAGGVAGAAAPGVGCRRARHSLHSAAFRTRSRLLSFRPV